MVIGIQVDGIEEMVSRLEDISFRLNQEIADALDQAAEAFVDDAQSNAPVDTGYLRDHIQIISASDNEVIVESTADYSGFVEFGTWKMDAQPFFEPAINSARNELERSVANIQL